MRHFKDKDGKTWTIDLTTGAVMRAKAGGRNLLDPTKHDLAETLDRDLAEFWEVLWAIVEPQATEKDITAEQFGELMASECLLSAQQTFFEEWRDFFHGLQRPDLVTVLEKMLAYKKKALSLVKAKLETLEREKIDERVTATMESTLNKSYGDLLESLDSILVPSPGGS